MAASGQFHVAVKHTDVVQTQEPALKDVQAFYVFAVDPPGEIQKKLVEDAGQELRVSFATIFRTVDLENLICRPRVHWRIYVAKSPFIRRYLPVRMHVPLTQHED